MIKELNLPCLYKVTLDTSTFIYSFTNKHGVEYDIAFVDATGYFTSTSGYYNIDNVYSLFVSKKGKDEAKYDPENEKTINAILSHFFEDSNKSLLYECETSDERELARYRKFNLWYSKSDLAKSIVKIDEPIVDGDGTTHYTTLMYHEENQYRDSLEVSHYEVLESYNKIEEEEEE